eukprot:TRINITY_DN6175_c0_g1_i1.p1 TRINITY_DN6175_c0_g1~~TRINITY_DN6175_c0_g1_i1.p1  ORF type:complete len:219 (+),score=13.87 TRINITY_DN6175_c0_g1_i1:44-700(+)
MRNDPSYSTYGTVKLTNLAVCCFSSVLLVFGACILFLELLVVLGIALLTLGGLCLCVSVSDTIRHNVLEHRKVTPVPAVTCSYRLGDSVVYIGGGSLSGRQYIQHNGVLEVGDEGVVSSIMNSNIRCVFPEVEVCLTAADLIKVDGGPPCGWSPSHHSSIQPQLRRLVMLVLFISTRTSTALPFDVWMITSCYLSTHHVRQGGFLLPWVLLSFQCKLE